MGEAAPADVTAVVVAFGAEPALPGCVKALLASRGVDIEVALVDNGCTDGGVDSVAALDGVRVIRPGRNLGFASACNRAVAESTGVAVVLVNPDAIVRDDAVAHLLHAVADGVGIATAGLRLADRPDRMNSAGNEVHFLGFSWCGGLGRPSAQHAVGRDVASASGAAMLLRRAVWERFGGLTPEYFMYYEDTELSMRCWRAGLRVVYVPDAVVEHHYEFARHPRKLYLVERNRLVALLTLADARTLVLLAPVLLLVELAMLGVACTQGWGGAKLRGWWWLGRNAGWLRRRRAMLAQERVVGDAALAPLLADHLSDGNVDVPSALRPFDDALAAYWRVVRAMLRR